MGVKRRVCGCHSNLFGGVGPEAPTYANNFKNISPPFDFANLITNFREFGNSAHCMKIKRIPPIHNCDFAKTKWRNWAEKSMVNEVQTRVCVLCMRNVF